MVIYIQMELLQMMVHHTDNKIQVFLLISKERKMENGDGSQTNVKVLMRSVACVKSRGQHATQL